MPTTHIIPLERRNLHGHFSPGLAPIARIQPGDTVVSSTLDANWFAGKIDPELAAPKPKFEPRTSPEDDGHALIGPIYIEGAQPGQTLAIDIKDLKPGNWGWSAGGGGDTWINRHFGWTALDARIWQVWDLDIAAMIGHDQDGHSVTLRPFLGLVGMPPPEAGVHSTTPPRVWGGNLDCKSLTVGTTLYLPVPVEGGLLSFGDGHAAQGDGEVSGVALECPMERVELTIDVRDDFPVSGPVANTPDGWLTMALNTDLNIAALEALGAMVDLMAALLKVDRKTALGLAGTAVDLRITQIANRVNGVHALLPHGAIR